MIHVPEAGVVKFLERKSDILWKRRGGESLNFGDAFYVINTDTSYGCSRIKQERWFIGKPTLSG